MNFIKLTKLAYLFQKKAQLLDDISSTNTISSDETSAFLEHAKMTAETSNEVYEWANSQIGELGTNDDQGKINTFTYSRDMRDSSLNFNNKAKEFINSTDSNKTVNSIEPVFTALMQNYNKLTGPEQLSDQWVADNQQFELSKKIKQMQSSMEYMKDYINKQKNVEVNSSNVPQLP